MTSNLLPVDDDEVGAETGAVGDVGARRRCDKTVSPGDAGDDMAVFVFTAGAGAGAGAAAFLEAPFVTRRRDGLTASERAN